VGVSNGNRDLEGTVGGHLDQSADVQAIVSFYGASNLTTILEQSTPKGLAVRIPALQLLLGELPDKAPELARLASPVFHVDANDPPLLLLHGNHDPQMPISQSQELHGNYEESGLPVRFVVVHGAAHSGKQFYDEQRTATVARFLARFGFGYPARAGRNTVTCDPSARKADAGEAASMGTNGAWKWHASGDDRTRNRLSARHPFRR
jgi:dienelactone hydrolase